MHEYNGSFQSQTVCFKMTSVCGHVMSLDFIGGCSHIGSCSFSIFVLIVFCCLKNINVILFKKKKCKWNHLNSLQNTSAQATSHSKGSRQLKVYDFISEYLFEKKILFIFFLLILLIFCTE